MKVAYCYAVFSTDIENPKLSEEQVNESRTNADKLRPAYRAALSDSAGKLTETALQMESDKARNNKSRGLSAAEYFMIRDSCDRLALE